MRKIGSLGLTIGASVVAVSASAFIFLAFAADKSGQVAEKVADAKAALTKALAILEALERDHKLTPAQATCPSIISGEIAKLP